MTPENDEIDLQLSRRKLLAAAGIYGGAAAVASLLPIGSAQATPASGTAPEAAATSPVSGLHLQFGADASSEVVVSWHALQPVQNPRVLVGGLDGRLERTVTATPVSYTDGKSKQTVYAYHAKIGDLKPDSAFLYGALHDGAQPEFGTFRTAPRGRSAFTFTSFGDQGTPTLARKFVLPEGVTIPSPPAYVNDNLGSPAAGDTTLGVERLNPLFHLFNGDLCYANIAQDRVRTWWDFWTNNTRSARNRPWMPSPGNHENELGNGPIGYQAYQTYFSVPEAAGQTDVTRGLWYAFTAGSVRMVSIANDDICYQDGGNSYVRGYSAGAQKAWLEKELAAARADRSIDWLVVCMHQVAISTVDQFNGADLGIREEWLPLFDKYEVDLVVCGHEHHYERSHPIRGRQSTPTLTPIPTATTTDVIDTTKGTVHMVIGGGGTSVPSNQLFFDPPQCRVITAVGAPDPKTGKRAPIYLKESAAWSAVRNAAHAYGFAAFAVDPGSHPGDVTTIKVTYYDVVGLDGQIAPFETFTLRRPRRD
ncbi:3',5'-cyclic AMP phosphodiesterase CpdA [Enhydrobacter aerosaccus]|uniref:3',5'-cyclic AMP phosphodiesterase CpdA n=1 Tax=Enhydrobacter aerosaccus TaxID=225324 RepID=A0A1T4SFS3_9HYPH|nr:metallophosphoesterase family protein [Enhydrobacter aerosaccus]SKA27047.1 3',5'-cyclic AMP phosphodiesterase CpdA [Enhydrobacter aerosaccus]